VGSTTYLAIRVVVQSMPPLLAASVRFLPAAGILFVWVVVRGGPGSLRITRAEAAGAAFMGTCLLVTGNGLVSLGEQGVPSGLAAVLLGQAPPLAVYGGLGLICAGLAVVISSRRAVGPVAVPLE